jgi:cell division protein FtsL
MSFMDRRIRGFRLVDVVAFGLLIALVLSVYLAKTIAGRERAEIATVERQIDEERARIRLLQAETAHLEQPARIEHLSSAYLGMAPVTAKQEARPEDLPLVASRARVR